MKMKIILGISTLFILLFFNITTILATTPPTYAGHEFSEDEFAVEVDLLPDPEDPYVIKDWTNTSNEETDPDNWEDLQFFLTYMNKSGIEVAYSAVEKWEHNITVGDLLPESIRDALELLGKGAVLEQDLFHLNVTAPFQQLVQHYTTPWDDDVFVTNNFMCLVAYSANETDREMDAGDDLYIGYTFAIQEIIDAINKNLEGKTDYRLGHFDYEANWEETSNGYNFGINYTNMFVLWQKIDTKPKSFDFFGNGQHVVPNDRGIIFGGDFVAASVLDHLAFQYEYKVETTEIGDNTVTLGTTTSHYHIGETNFLMTGDNEAFITSHSSNFTESPFVKPISFEVDFPGSGPIILPGGLGTIPDKINITTAPYAFYVEDDAKMRLLLENSFGITVVTSTTTFGISIEDEDPTYSNNVNTNNPTIGMALGGNEFFFTDFNDKMTYKLKGLDKEPWNEPEDVDHAVVVHVFDPSGWAITDVAKWYFAIEFGLAYGFTVFFATAVTPEIFEVPEEDVYIACVLYLTLTEFPEWYGGQIVHDPAYSAVAAYAATEEDSSSSEDEDGDKSSSAGGIPGFEVIPLLVAITGVSLVLRKRQK